MPNYVEKFVLAKGNTQMTLAISDEPADSIFTSNKKAGFHPWAGGCGIGHNQKTIAEARAICFQYARSRLAQQIEETEARLKELQSLHEQLGTDWFNLGQFKVKA